MNNIVDFISSIGYSNFEESVTAFFDENMALYNFVNDYDIITHNKCPKQIDGRVDESSIKFILTFSNENDAIKMHNIMGNLPITVFNRTFHTTQTLNGSSIIVEFF